MRERSHYAAAIPCGPRCQRVSSKLNGCHTGHWFVKGWTCDSSSGQATTSAQRNGLLAQPFESSTYWVGLEWRWQSRPARLSSQLVHHHPASFPLRIHPSLYPTSLHLSNRPSPYPTLPHHSQAHPPLHPRSNAGSKTHRVASRRWCEQRSQQRSQHRCPHRSQQWSQQRSQNQDHRSWWSRSHDLGALPPSRPGSGLGILGFVPRSPCYSKPAQVSLAAPWRWAVESTTTLLVSPYYIPTRTPNRSPIAQKVNN